MSAVVTDIDRVPSRRPLPRRGRGGTWMRRTGAAVGMIVGATLAWWMAVAGPVTVFRIVYHNQTGIEDFKEFPARSLHASDSPAPFNRVAGSFAGGPWGTPGELARLLDENDTVAFLVVRGNDVVFERYFDGWTERSRSQSFSMGKSFLSMLVGSAIRDGYVRSANDAVTEYVPELAANGFGGVTIDDLLQMKSGSNYVENENPFGVHARFTYTPDVEKEILELRVEQGPGAWSYKSGDTAVLTLALSRALEPKTLTDYTQEILWSPLGMEDPGLWSIDRPGGLEKTWCCLAATARDYAKLGRLYLREGRFRGAEVIPADWVRRSVGTGFESPPAIDEHHAMMGVWSYHSHWWLISREHRDFMAAGHGGQFLYMHPATDTVIVRLGRSQGSLAQREWIELFQEVARV